MKHLHKYILAAAVTAIAGGALTSCDNDFDCPPVVVPGELGEGTAATPLTVNGVKAFYTAYYSDVPDASTYYWATGYIVGCAVTTETVFVANDATSVFDAPFGSATNLLLAPTPDCTDYSQCIALQLPSGAVRTALNLSDNPANKGRLVTVHGYIDKYLGLPGMRQVDSYNWGAEGIPGMEPTIYRLASTITSGKGYALVAKNGTSYSIAKPADAGANYGWLYVNGATDNAGIIKGDASAAFMFTESETPGQYYILDSYGRYLYMEGTYNSFQLSTSLQSGNNNFLWMANHNADGTWNIVNCGNSKTVQYYVEKTSFGAYSEIQAGYLLPMLYELDGEMTLPDNPGQGGGDTPNPPAPTEGTIYTALAEADADITAGWTFDNVSLSGDLTYVWSWKEYSGSHYLNGSAYLGGAQAAEAYAVSGMISLAGCSDVTVSFDHAAKFQTTLKSGCGIAVRAEGETAWTMLTIPTWPAAGAWTWANSGEISLSAYEGKNIQIAFKYVSTSAGADTWEIKNLVVKGKK